MENEYKELFKIFKELEGSDTAYRFEKDDSGYHLSLIDRKVYPRVWVDNANDGDVIIDETSEHFLNRELQSLEKDWYKRFSGDTLQEMINDYKN